MSGEECRRWQGPLAMRALGRPDDVADPGLDAHLDGCPDCRAELAELRGVAELAARADPAHVGVPAIAPGLGQRILDRVAEEAGASRRRRRKLVLAAVGAAAAVLVAVLAAIGLAGGEPDGGRRVDLAGPGAMDGTAVLADRAWGTEVTIELSGLDAGQRYWVWTTGVDGHRVAAGTLTGTEGSARAVLASALPLEDTRRVWVTDEDDVVVLDARVGS